ncbi:ATP-binding protein [uncultured Dokdonia sp.]|uniref:sensor histidine kinase n=1 Tax=uncultured Dokdonia sp. TaxID=575653 RepID=UPI0026232ECF|nr:ATP-binding protein [uncultured Dokdonia sp.]
MVQQISKHEVLLVVYFIIVVVVLVFLFILFFYTFQRRKNKLLIEKVVAQKEYESALVQVENEIQEATLKNVGMELHDNVGQLLSVAKMQLRSGLMLLPEDKKETFTEALETVDLSLIEVRQLSKTVNGEVLANMDLQDAIQVEIDRINRFSHTNSTLTVSGDPIFVGEREKIIIFRIVQECCSNVIKHADAEHLVIDISYKEEHLHIFIKDDGIGYNTQNNKLGSGLINMQRRAEMIHAQLVAHSKQGHGTEITLTYQPPLHETAQSSHR